MPPPSLPFALVERGNKGLRLAAVNAAAREFGLMRGQRLADARAAVPDLLSEAHEPEQDIASLLGLCRWMERYSPWVAPDAPDGILMEVTGIPHLFGGEAAMMAGMKARLAGYASPPAFPLPPPLGPPGRWPVMGARARTACRICRWRRSASMPMPPAPCGGWG